MQGGHSYFILLLLYSSFLTNLTEGQLLWPWERAAELMVNFSMLPLVGHGEQCANPKRLRGEFLEILLEEDHRNLADSKVVDSISIYDRWNEQGGHRCDPSRYECRQISDGKLYTCHCPQNPLSAFNTADVGEGLGNQKVTEVKNSRGEVTGCKFESDAYSKTMAPNNAACSGVMFPTNLPASYHNEIVCGIFIEDNVTVSYNNSIITTIESGLHFNKIDCPVAGQKCLMKEFNAECTPENLEDLRKNWIHSPNFNRENRLKTWPPCTCSSALASSFPFEDPNEKKIVDLFYNLPKAEFGKSCDRSELDKMVKCARANWYLYPDAQVDAFQMLFDHYMQNQAAPDCDSKKGLLCASSASGSSICRCDKIPTQPGWSPQRPSTVNKDGYCELDPGSDCTAVPDAPGYLFRCPVGYNCLIDRFNATCNSENLLKAEKLDNQNEKYLDRCYCSASHVENDVKPLPGKKVKSVSKGLLVKVKKSVTITLALCTTAAYILF